MASRSMRDQGAAIPHLSKGEIADLRSDVDAAFEIGEVAVEKTTIAAAAIKTLRATPVELVPAPGAGNALQFMGAMLRLKSGSEVLTEATDNLGVKYTDGSGVQVSETVETTGFIDAAANAVTNARPALDAIVAADAALNAALVLHNIGAAEIAGNASDDAVLEVYTSYKIHQGVAV